MILMMKIIEKSKCETNNKQIKTKWISLDVLWIEKIPIYRAIVQKKIRH